jgi:lysophospholipase L1-like esterase
MGVLLGGCEGYARLREGPPKPKDLGGLFRRDPELGRALRAGFRGESHSGFGIRIQVAVNGLGMRDERVATPKPSGALRIACLGGSTTFGFGASTNDLAWPNALERSLEASSPRPVEVLNAGVHAWTLPVSLRNLERLGDLEIDALVVLHAHNDLYAGHEPAYQALARGEQAPPAVPSALLDALEGSAAVRRARRRFVRWRRRTFKRAQVDPAGVEAFEAALRALIARAEERGQRLLLCTFPHQLPLAGAAPAYPLDGDRGRDLERHLVHELDVFVRGLEDYNQRIRRIGAEAGVPVCDLARDLPRDPALYVDFVHHSDAGHEAMAALVQGAIVRAGWLR